MPLTPRYDIVPHGIIADAGKVYAAFKIIVSLAEFQQSTYLEVTEKDWNEAAKLVDAASWHYKVQFAATKTILIKRNATEPDYKKFSLRAKATNGNIKDLDTFHFGQRNTGTTMAQSFNFLSHSKFFIPATGGAAAAQPELKQFEPVVTATSGQADGSDYTSILRSANEYARRNKFATSADKSDDSSGLNLKAIYASLLDEPLAAEVQYGLIREFLIDITELIKQDDKINYAINLEASQEGNSAEMFRLERRTIDGFPKYYNGLRKIHFIDKDFKKVRYEFIDPYKKELEGDKSENNLHPDGIYISAVYNPSAPSFIDPFSETGIKGFNTLVKTDKGMFSLTIHDKKLAFPRSGQLTIQKETGHLNARSAIKIDDKTTIRFNLLLAWRGDNLVVNRIPKDLEKDDAKEMEEGKGKLESVQEYCAEDTFVQKNLLTKTEHLIPGTQIQLLAGAKYEFIFRSVSITHHCIPFKSELHPPQLQHVLTIEEMGKDISSLLPAIPFDVQSVDKLPIKSPTIVGPNLYTEATSDVVDKPQHLVLNKIKKETAETRFIYPPMIKMEDFKILGGLTVDAMTIDKQPRPTKNQYIARCIELERKLRDNIPPIYAGQIPITYMGDPRGKHLYIIPSDFFTATQLKADNLHAYPFESNYPFFNKVFAAKIEASVRAGNNQIIFKGINTSAIVTYNKLVDGIYNFHVYVTDKPLQGSAIADELKKYNATQLRVTILNNPAKPTISKNIFEAKRYPDASKNYWYVDPGIGKESSTWKSLKYLEETKVLKIQHNNLDDLLKDYYAEGGKEVELLDDEYPYEMFLRDEGSISAKEGLMPFIYPSEVNIKYKIPAGLKGSGTFFRIRLNDEEVLEARYDSAGHSLRFGDNTVAGAGFSLTIVFSPADNTYSILKDGASWQTLKKFINPDITIHDLEIPKEVLPYIQLDNTGDLNFERSGKYIFIADQRDPYYRAKKLKLFASSPFQAYFPSEKTEFPLGTEGPILDLKIPNNSLPETPIVEAKILLMHEKTESWSETGSLNIKQNKTESLVRLTMQQDFMKEGKNKLGIVLCKTPCKADTPPFNIEESADVSRFGEDITKLTTTDLSTTTFKELLNFGTEKTALKKYCPKSETNFYQIGASIYEVIELDPYYNSRLRKWQVVLPFKFLLSSEVMFMKFVCLKISPGHGLHPGPSSPANPFIDTTKTNLSVFSDAVQFPVYSSKVIRVSKTKQEGRNAFTISVNSHSVYKNKCYFVMLSNENSETRIVNEKLPGETDKFSSMVNFSLDPGLENPERGKVLVFKDQAEVTISRENCYSIWVLECEIHNNSERTFKSTPEFINENPFFEIKGIRPINLMEFTN